MSTKLTYPSTQLMLAQAKRAAVGENKTGVFKYDDIAVHYYPRSRREAWFDKHGPINKSDVEKRLNDVCERFDDAFRKRYWQIEVLASATLFARLNTVRVVTDIGASMISGFGDLIGWRHGDGVIELLFD